MPNAVIYCRVSTRNQALHGRSLGIQFEECMKFCECNGLKVHSVFSEFGSGAPSNRYGLPARRQVVQIAKASDSWIVCVSPDRFSREPISESQHIDVILSGRVLFVWDQHLNRTMDLLNIKTFNVIRCLEEID